MSTENTTENAPETPVVEVDTEQGSIVYLARDADGHIFVQDDEIVHRTLWARDVRVEFDDRYDPALAADMAIYGKWGPAE